MAGAKEKLKKNKTFLWLQSFLEPFLSFGQKLSDDGIEKLAAHTAFFVILSFFPFVMFLLTLFSYFPFFTNDLSVVNLNFLPQAVSSMITEAFSSLSSRANTTILSLTVLLALWSAARGFLSIMTGLNRILEVKETRNYFLMRLLASIYTIVFAILLLLMMILFVFGEQLLSFFVHLFPIFEQYALFIISIRTVVGIAVLTFFFLLIYLSLPNRKSKLLKELPGALLSAVGWVSFSFLFSIYVNNFSNYSAIYGSLTAIILCMLWLYSCMYILFFGAEINALFYRQSPKAFLKKIFKKKKP